MTLQKKVKNNNMSVVEVVDETGYRALLASERLAVLHFWADFAAECRTVTAVLTELGTGVGLGHYSRILSFLSEISSNYIVLFHNRNQKVRSFDNFHHNVNQDGQ
jgi:hypothetical protein